MRHVFSLSLFSTNRLNKLQSDAKHKWYKTSSVQQHWPEPQSPGFAEHITNTVRLSLFGLACAALAFKKLSESSIACIKNLSRTNGLSKKVRAKKNPTRQGTRWGQLLHAQKNQWGTLCLRVCPFLSGRALIIDRPYSGSKVASAGTSSTGREVVERREGLGGIVAGVQAVVGGRRDERRRREIPTRHVHSPIEGTVFR
jgi:hypothetical protein